MYIDTNFLGRRMNIDGNASYLCSSHSESTKLFYKTVDILRCQVLYCYRSWPNDICIENHKKIWTIVSQICINIEGDVGCRQNVPYMSCRRDEYEKPEGIRGHSKTTWTNFDPLPPSSGQAWTFYVPTPPTWTKGAKKAPPFIKY